MFGVLRPGSPEHEHPPVSPSASPPPPLSLAQMPLSVFGNREELLEGCKDWAATQGYAIVIARSRFNRLWLKCDRGGKYENRRNLTPDQRKRKRGDSRLLGCPFKMIAACKKDGTWTVNTEISEHNHGPSDDLSAHPTLRRMTDQQLQKVHDMCDAGRSPAETLEQLRTTWPDIKVLTRDIYNARKKYKTLKEEAERAAGVSQEQSYQDPNELGFRGPNPNGRWAWVPDGEEVTNKKLKRKRKSMPTPQKQTQSTLDPQLHSPESSHSAHRPSLRDPLFQNGFGDQHDPAEQLRSGAQHHYEQYNQAASNLQRQVPTDSISNPPNYYRNADDGTTIDPSYASPSSTAIQPNNSHSGHSGHRPNGSSAPTATMSSTNSSADANVSKPSSNEPKAQVLMSRIERMEKEQKDQKNMLAQILGAVQGFRGSPGSEVRT